MDSFSISGSDPAARFAALTSSLDRHTSADFRALAGTASLSLGTEGAAGHTTSSLSVDSMTYRRSERTTLYIRTQEGDVVRLKFRSRESVQVEAVRAEDGGSIQTELELSAKSKSKLSIQVHGDLNAEELVAIQSAIEQAGALAEEFFSGDLAAAFDSAAALDIDGSQLARVSLNVRAREQLTYSSSRLTASSPRGHAMIRDIPVLQPVATRTAMSPATDGVPTESIQGALAMPTEVASAEQPEELEHDQSPLETLAMPAADTSGLSQLSGFLNRLMEVFGEGHMDGTRGRSHSKLSASIDVSLKLRIFQSTLLVFAEARQPEVASPLPELVPETIDELVGQLQPPLDQVA